ncbi:hypothetical protein CLF_111667 [Clonorchis sinensis]|uniref:Uncharacterized protein n=1 Tax=Clonorchis sinensis TaxID=79923 RepID=G7YV73_CLOSI|nr:hypothetical protein CLF_111667 [Clonorchis sinensis]
MAHGDNKPAYRIVDVSKSSNSFAFRRHSKPSRGYILDKVVRISAYGDVYYLPENVCNTVTTEMKTVDKTLAYRPRNSEFDPRQACVSVNVDTRKESKLTRDNRSTSKKNASQCSGVNEDRDDLCRYPYQPMLSTFTGQAKLCFPSSSENQQCDYGPCKSTWRKKSGDHIQLSNNDTFRRNVTDLKDLFIFTSRTYTGPIVVENISPPPTKIREKGSYRERTSVRKTLIFLLIADYWDARIDISDDPIVISFRNLGSKQSRGEEIDCASYRRGVTVRIREVGRCIKSHIHIVVSNELELPSAIKSTNAQRFQYPKHTLK